MKRHAYTEKEAENIKIPQQHNVKARHQGTTDNSHTGTAHILREVLM
jgi:hypothetical protein